MGLAVLRELQAGAILPRGAKVQVRPAEFVVGVDYFLLTALAFYDFASLVPSSEAVEWGPARHPAQRAAADLLLTLRRQLLSTREVAPSELPY